jgi:DNA-binding transcriptional LysR family regulator
MSIRLDPLMSVLAIAEQGSVSRAAQILHTSQPALSRTLREFEGALGLVLFDRGPRGVTPTPAGSLLLGRARAIRAEALRAEREVAAFRAASSVPLRVGIVPVLAVQLITDAVLSTRVLHPDVRIHIEAGPQAELHARLRAGDLDLVIGPEPEGPGNPPLVFEPVFVDELVLIARAEHAAARSGPVRLAELEDVRWILPSPESPERRRIDALFRVEGLEIPIADIESDDVPFLLITVTRSELLCALPRSTALAGRALGLAILPLEPTAGRGRVGGVRRANAEPGTGSAALLDALRRVFDAADEQA